MQFGVVAAVQFTFTAPTRHATTTGICDEVDFEIKTSIKGIDIFLTFENIISARICGDGNWCTAETNINFGFANKFLFS